MTTMTEEILVDTGPMTSFRVFTDEFDQWWGRGAIDAYDSWRLVERLIEGGVGAAWSRTTEERSWSPA